MGKVGLFYATTTGNTERVAEMIKEKFKEVYGEDIVDLYNIADSSAVEALNNYDTYIFGVSTWYDGDFQDFWKMFLPNLESIDFSNKKVAIFGLGDQLNHGNYFVDAMGLLYDLLTKKGAKIYGFWSTEGYDFKNSKAVKDGKFVGLAVDEDNQPELTPERIDKWVKQLKEEGFV